MFPFHQNGLFLLTITFTVTSIIFATVTLPDFADVYVFYSNGEPRESANVKQKREEDDSALDLRNKLLEQEHTLRQLRIKIEQHTVSKSVMHMLSTLTSKMDEKHDKNSSPKITWVASYGFNYVYINEGFVNAGIHYNEEVHVIRALTANGALIPGKAIRGHSKAYVPTENFQEYATDYFEILIIKPPQEVKWVHSCGFIPENAVIGGYTSQNEKIYIGRVSHEGEMCGCIIPKT